MKIGNTQSTNESLISLKKAKDEEKDALKKIFFSAPCLKLQMAQAWLLQMHF